MRFFRKKAEYLLHNWGFCKYNILIITFYIFKEERPYLQNYFKQLLDVFIYSFLIVKRVDIY